MIEIYVINYDNELPKIDFWKKHIPIEEIKKSYSYATNELSNNNYDINILNKYRTCFMSPNMDINIT